LPIDADNQFPDVSIWEHNWGTTGFVDQLSLGSEVADVKEEFELIRSGSADKTMFLGFLSFT
jgi:hypothetical protein